MSICFDDIYFKKWKWVMSHMAMVGFLSQQKIHVFLNSLGQSYTNGFLYLFSCADTEGTGVPYPLWVFENVM